MLGGNFALPLESALAVDGCEMGGDPAGLEDCVFGHMLRNTGYEGYDLVVEMWSSKIAVVMCILLNSRVGQGHVSERQERRTSRSVLQDASVRFTPSLQSFGRCFGKSSAVPGSGCDADYRELVRRQLDQERRHYDLTA